MVASDGVTRVQIYAANCQLLYLAPSGGESIKYVHMRTHIVVEVSGTTVTCSHTNTLGSLVAQTHAAGVILEQTHSMPCAY